MQKITNYIDGKFKHPSSNTWLDNSCPATGQVYGKLPNSNAEDVEEAYRAANNAFEEWSNLTIEKRSGILLKIADLIETNAMELARAESKDSGKPLTLAKTVDIPRAASNFRFYAHAITQFFSESHAEPGNKMLNYTLRQPIGVVGCISPWNLPLYLFTWKIAPALAAGNCVVAKPSEITPITAYLLAKICKEAGLPNGVLNIVHGLGNTTGTAIVSHPKIKAISFTGGTKTGATIASIAAPMFKKLSLELGGKNPNLIFANCDYAKMLATTVKSSFSNQGQICLCGSRIFVEQGIYEQFKKDFIAEVKELQVGHPKDQKSDLGAVVSEEHLQKIDKYIKLAKNDPENTILYGGNRVSVKGCENGYYFQPTIIEVSSNQCQLNQEEIFGPVVTIMSFKDEAEALYLANDVTYGLSATIWTNNLSRTMRLTEKIEAGIVWVNTWMARDLRTPFGGIKNSGMGREGGFEALRFFTEAKNVCVQY